jgi:hypothetical protein
MISLKFEYPNVAKSSHPLVVYEVGFQALTAASMKMAVFWVAAPCSLVEVIHRPDDGGSKYL